MIELYKTKLKFSDFIKLIICCLAAVLPGLVRSISWQMIFVFTSIVFLFTLYSIKTFLIYNDRIVIRRPFFLIKKEFSYDEINFVKFHFNASRLTSGKYIDFQLKSFSKKENDSFIINLSIEEIKNIVELLNRFEVKVLNELK